MGEETMRADALSSMRHLALALVGSIAPTAMALADSTQATCILSRDHSTVPSERGTCRFSQRQGNVNVRFNSWAFRFPSDEQGVTYQRSHSPAGISFRREGQYTLQVLWQQSRNVIPKPKYWASHNIFLGRWQGQSTAGRAVLDVLSVEPNRVRWGNKANGICDSDYSVKTLPSVPGGHDPDQLVPSRKPTERGYAITRLTLKPRPCSTGAAVIQLAMPLDHSDHLKVVTYGADGTTIGHYGMVYRLP